MVCNSLTVLLIFKFFHIQHMMPPYGAPYAAIYPHGGIYAHPSIAMVSTSLVYYFYRAWSNDYSILMIVYFEIDCLL